MKKLAFIFGMIFWGSLFAAAAEDAPTITSIPQRTILDILPPEVITGPIFDHLSECDITAFTSVNRYARSLRKSVVVNIDPITQMLHEQTAIGKRVLQDRGFSGFSSIDSALEDLHPRVVKLLKRYQRNVSSIKITHWCGDLFIPALNQLAYNFRFCHINTLDLSENDHCTSGGFATFVSRLPSLQRVDISNSSVDSLGIPDPHLSQLTYLNISGTEINFAGIDAISSNLLLLETLEAERLKLDFNCAQAISKLANLRILNIRDNQIQDKGAKAIGEALKGLEILDVSNNGINFEGAYAIVTGLPELKKLNIAENGVGRAAKKDAIALMSMHTLEAFMRSMRKHNISPPPEIEQSQQEFQQVYKWANAEAEEEIRQLLPHTEITF